MPTTRVLIVDDQASFRRQMRVILVSAQNDSGQMLEKSAIEAGAEAFIPKDNLELEVVKKWTDQAPTSIVNPPGALT